MEYKKIEDGSLNNEIGNAISLLGTGNKAMQSVLIAILLHVEAHGEVSKANKIVKDMGDSDDIPQTSVKAVTDFLVGFGRMDWDKDASIFVVNMKKKTKLNGNKEAKATMWWTFKPAKVAKGFDYLEEIAKVNKKARKMIGRIAELINENKPDEAAAITINQKNLQAINLINSGVVSADIVLDAAKASLKIAA